MADFFHRTCALDGARWSDRLREAALHDWPLEIVLDGERAHVDMPTMARGRLKRIRVGELPEYEARRVRRFLVEGCNVEIVLIRADRDGPTILVSLYVRGAEVTRAYRQASERRAATLAAMREADAARSAEDAARAQARRERLAKAIVGTVAAGSALWRVATTTARAWWGRYWRWLVRVTN